MLSRARLPSGRLLFVLTGGLLVGITLALLLLSSVRPPAGKAPGVLTVLGQPAASAAGRTESRSFFSPILGRQMPFIVHLPPGYDTELNRRYPVLYMLHGLSGTDEEWTWYQLFDTADAMIRQEEIEPLILVLPQGDDSYWVDHAGGGPRWGAYTAVDIVGEIDRSYRTLADRAHRGIGGLSMGADGALQLALNYPDVFGIAIGNSAVLRRHDTAPSYFGDSAWFRAHDPVSLFADRPGIARELAIELDVGFDDQWRPNVEALHSQLVSEAIPHAWQENPGAHDAAYWTARIPDDLRFFEDSVLAPTLTE